MLFLLSLEASFDGEYTGSGKRSNGDGIGPFCQDLTFKQLDDDDEVYIGDITLPTLYSKNGVTHTITSGTGAELGATDQSVNTLSINYSAVDIGSGNYTESLYKITTTDSSVTPNIVVTSEVIVRVFDCSGLDNCQQCEVEAGTQWGICTSCDHFFEWVDGECKRSGTAIFAMFFGYASLVILLVGLVATIGIFLGVIYGILFRVVFELKPKGKDAVCSGTI